MKNYFIVGGSSGIGKTLVELLEKEGHNIFATFNSQPQKNREHVYFQQLNSQEGTVDLSFLPEQLDGVVYCPGSISLKPFDRIKPEEFLEDYHLQFLGAVKIIQACLSQLKKSNLASIVLFSTIAVQTGFPYHSLVASSKGAIEGLTRSLAAEFAPIIRVNCIAPSLTDTPLACRILGSEEKKKINDERHPLKRVGKPEDIAEMAKFLLSENSNWISGQVFHVDGGLSTLKN